MICRHFGVCGGCQWQDVPYAEQLARKRETLARLLAQSLGRRAPHVEPMIGMPPGEDGMPWRFRQKAAFVFGPASRGRGLVMGHYAEGSRTIVPVAECPVHADRANRIAFALRDRLARANVPAAGPRLDGILRHLIVRTTADEREAVVLLVVTRNDKSLRTPIRAFLDSPERPTGFFLNIHDRPGPYMVGRETLRLDGRSQVREDLAGLPFLISPTAFFQTNVDAAATLLRLAGDAVGASRQRVLDLYAGSGFFAVALAARGHRVTAVEENAQAARDAEANARLNKLADGSLRMIAARVEDALPRLARERFDVVILDPPRQGCPAATLAGVFERLAPARAIYVSCHPEALAGELPGILGAGYGIARVQPVDMFPHTPHIETLVTLERVSSSS